MAATVSLAEHQDESAVHDGRLQTLKAVQQFRHNVIGQLEAFEELFGPSNTLMPLSYSLQSKSKYEFVDFGYKLCRDHEVLIGPIYMYGLCKSTEHDKSIAKLNTDISEGKERLMMLISNCDNISHKPSGSLLSLIFNDMANKLDNVLSNAEIVKRITSRYPRFDALAFARNKKNILQKYISGKENYSCDPVRLRVDIAPTTDENYTCYEISQGLCRTKGHCYFMPPMLRRGYLILKMPYIRAVLTWKSTDYLFKLNAKMMMVEKIENTPPPSCFDISTGKAVDDTEAIFMLDGCSDVDWSDEVENVIVLPSTRELSELTTATSEHSPILPPFCYPRQDLNDNGSKSEPDTFEDDDVDMTADVSVHQGKILSCAISDFIKTIRDEGNWSPSIANLSKFVNRFIRVMKRKKASLLYTDGRTVNVNGSVVRELSITDSRTIQTPAAFEDLVEQYYDRFRLNCDTDEIMRSCWNETFSHEETTTWHSCQLTNKKKRSATSITHNASKNRQTKR
uniref:Uncharacterized protein IVSP2-1 n=1 Tax=Hyposoter didymator TaxID=260305 RepID=D7P5M5_HYPDD|nr:unknown [Hyposoter didymator]